MDAADRSVSLSVVEIDALGNAERNCPILCDNSNYTEIICFCDMIAMQVFHFLKTLGKLVPQDVVDTLMKIIAGERDILQQHILQQELSSGNPLHKNIILPLW